MKLSNKIKGKPTLFKNKDSYSYILYSDENENEIIFNNTNLEAPEYIINKTKDKKLNKKEIVKGPILNYIKKEGERSFEYEKSILKRRTRLANQYWSKNIGDCQIEFKTVEDFLKICLTKIKKRIIVLE